MAVKWLRGIACQHVLADSDVPTAVEALHRISDDPRLLTEAAAPYVRDKARHYQRQAAKLLHAAGANLAEARRISDEPSKRRHGMSGLNEQCGHWPNHGAHPHRDGTTSRETAY